MSCPAPSLSIHFLELLSSPIILPSSRPQAPLIPDSHSPCCAMPLSCPYLPSSSLERLSLLNAPNNSIVIIWNYFCFCIRIRWLHSSDVALATIKNEKQAWGEGRSEAQRDEMVEDIRSDKGGTGLRYHAKDKRQVVLAFLSAHLANQSW